MKNVLLFIVVTFQFQEAMFLICYCSNLEMSNSGDQLKEIFGSYRLFEICKRFLFHAININHFPTNVFNIPNASEDNSVMQLLKT